MKNLTKNLIEKISISLSILFSSKAVKKIIKNFTEIDGGLFVGIREYQNKANEIANHVINVNFSYNNAVINDIKKLQNATEKDIVNIARQFNIEVDLVKKAMDKLLNSLINNQNKETASNQSKAQNDSYISICPSIKIHRETRNFYIYGLRVSKNVLVEGEYKKVNHRPLTVAQNAIKKYFDFTTAKYKNYIVAPDKLKAVASNKNLIQLKS